MHPCMKAADATYQLKKHKLMLIFAFGSTSQRRQATEKILQTSSGSVPRGRWEDWHEGMKVWRYSQQLVSLALALDRNPPPITCKTHWLTCLFNPFFFFQQQKCRGNSRCFCRGLRTGLFPCQAPSLPGILLLKWETLQGSKNKKSNHVP